MKLRPPEPPPPSAEDWIVVFLFLLATGFFCYVLLFIGASASME